MNSRKLAAGEVSEIVGSPPVQDTVMPWWLMSWVWLTVTFRFLKSLYMNDSGPVGSALPRSEFGASSPGAAVVIGLLLASSRPWVQGTVMADAVWPPPLIWSARACPGTPMRSRPPAAAAASSALSRWNRRSPAWPGRCTWPLTGTLLVRLAARTCVLAAGGWPGRPAAASRSAAQEARQPAP